MPKKTRYYVYPSLEAYGLRVIKEKGSDLKLEGINYIDAEKIRIWWRDSDGVLRSELLSPPDQT